jgi:hypothetical protein
MKAKSALFGILTLTLALLSQGQAQVPFTNNLVAYYPFNGNANDATTNGNNGTIFGMATFGVNRFGITNSCLSLPGGEGGGSGVNVPSLSNTPLETLTYSAWFWLSNYTPAGQLAFMPLIGRMVCGNTQCGAICINSESGVSTNQFSYFTGGTGYYMQQTAPLNSWCQVVFTLGTSGNANFYLNGTNVASSGSAPASQPLDFCIGSAAADGCGSGGDMYVWDGLIDDVRVYNRVLSSNEVQELYQYESIPPNLAFLSNGLVAYYPFNGNANDATSNGNNGTLLGTATFGVDRFGNSNSCLSLPAANDNGSGVDVPSLDTMPYFPVTYSAWFLLRNYPPPPSGDVYVMTLVGREENDLQSEGALVLFSEPSAYGIHITNNLIYFTGAVAYSSDLVPPTNQWCQLVLTISSNGTLNFYLNGTNLPGSGTASAGGSPIDFRIGASGGSVSSEEYVWNGLIDDVRIYNRDLSSNEVQQLYAYESVSESVPPCAPYAATATAILTNDFVVGAIITDGGCGYTNTPTVQIIGGGGSGAAAVAVVSNGVVIAIDFSTAGSNYTNTPLVIIDPPFISNPVLTIAPFSFLTFSNLTLGGVYQLQQLTAGYYWSNQQAYFTATNSIYTQMLPGVINNGDYRVALNPVPTQAFATPEVVNGFVVGATVTSGGSGYITAPTISIIGDGTNASASSEISGGVVTNVVVSNAGSGYTSGTTIQITPPPAVAVSPNVQLVMQINSSNLAPDDNYQIQYTPALNTAWSNWNGGLFTPTDVTNLQNLFVTNAAGFFRLQYVP